ncbi:hypothetical protein N2152v2_010050 [Parachlorella kessleri]
MQAVRRPLRHGAARLWSRSRRSVTGRPPPPPAAGSTAAAVHSYIGPTIAAKAAGGIFAAAQAVGATGAVTAAPAGAVVALSTLGGTAAGVVAGSSTFVGRQASELAGGHKE